MNTKTKFSFLIGLLIPPLLLSYFYFTPFKVNTWKLTNGEKEIIFQEMAHSGDVGYFTNVYDNMTKYVDNGYVYYKEGFIRSDYKSDKVMEFFAYRYASCDKKKFELEKQSLFDSIYFRQTRKSITVDMKTSELVKNVRMKDIKRKKEYFCLMLNKNMYNVKLHLMRPDESLERVALKPRDKNLADYILNSEDKKIYVMYGKFHFDGVYEILKNNGFKKELINKESVLWLD